MNLLKTHWRKLLLLISAIVLIGYYGINPLLNKLLIKQVEQKLIGNFSYNYDTIQVNIFNRSVLLKNVEWQFPKDSSLLKHRGKVKYFKVAGISWASLFGDLTIKSVEIASPEFNTKIEVNKLINQKTDSVKLGQFDFYQLIKGQLNQLSINEIKITNAQAKWYAPDFKTVWREVNGGSLDIVNLKIDSATTASQNGMFGLDEFKLSFNNANLFLSDSLHRISIGKTTLDYLNKYAKIDSLRIQPIIKKQDIIKQFKYEKTAIDLFAKQVFIKGFNYRRLFLEQYMDISNIAINDLTLEAYKDKNAYFPKRKAPLLPQKIIQQLSKRLKVDSISLLNAAISYTQKAEKSNQEGTINFDKLNAAIYDLTNDTILLNKNPIARIEFNTMLYGQSLLNGKIYFDMTSPTQAHTIDGHLSSFDLKIANKILTPLKAYEVRSGELKELKFRFNADQQKATGSLSFLYINLKMDKLDFKSLKGDKLDDQLFSMLANGFVIKNANPDRRGNERLGEINYVRQKDKSILHYWWYSILSGIKTVAVPSQTK